MRRRREEKGREFGAKTRRKEGGRVRHVVSFGVSRSVRWNSQFRGKGGFNFNNGYMGLYVGNLGFVDYRMML